MRKLLITLITLFFIISCGDSSNSHEGDADTNGSDLSQSEDGDTVTVDEDSAESVDGDSETEDTATPVDKDSTETEDTETEDTETPVDDDAAEVEDSTQTDDNDTPVDEDSAETPDEDIEPCTGILISDIQNSASSSNPAENSTVTVCEAVVTAAPFSSSKGFGIFISDIVSTAAPFSGIYVYSSNGSIPSTLTLGDKIRITGTYKEYYENSQIVPDEITKIGTSTVPAPAAVSDPSSIATGGANAEKYEGVLVTLSSVTVTNENPDAPQNFGQFAVTGNLYVDDEIYDFTHPSLGDSFESLTGVVAYTYYNFKLFPRFEEDFSAGETPDTTPDEDTPDTSADIDTETPDEDFTGFSFRAMAANITSGSQQAYEGPGIRIFQALKPDIVMIQEFNYKSGSIRDLVDEAFGEDFHYTHGNGSIPNGVVSRWPILDSGYWDDPNIPDRDLDWAIVDIPGSTELFLVSVHLHTDPASDQVEAAQIVAKKVYEHRAANPGGYYYMVGGDFNSSSAVSDNGFGKYNGSNIFYVSGNDPVDKNGNEDTNANRNKQYDFILPDHNLKNFQTSVIIESTEDSDTLIYPHGLVFDSRVYSSTEISEFFAPVLDNDSGAGYMQHMAIIKDFTIN